jgi:hypothetical protein
MYSKDDIHSFSGFFRVNTQSCSSKYAARPSCFQGLTSRGEGWGRGRCEKFADVAVLQILHEGERQRGDFSRAKPSFSDIAN